MRPSLGPITGLLPFMADVAVERVQSHGFCFTASFGTMWNVWGDYKLIQILKCGGESCKTPTVKIPYLLASTQNMHATSTVRPISITHYPCLLSSEFSASQVIPRNGIGVFPPCENRRRGVQQHSRSPRECYD